MHIFIIKILSEWIMHISLINYTFFLLIYVSLPKYPHNAWEYYNASVVRNCNEGERVCVRERELYFPWIGLNWYRDWIYTESLKTDSVFRS